MSFLEITQDIISHPLFTELQTVQHHGGENSLYLHSVATAKCAYQLARKFHMREDRVRAVTRAALLHDFFGYNWQSERHRRYTKHYSGWKRLTHTSHMFPLAPMPRNSEGWVLTLADKLVASKEVGETVGWHMRRMYQKVLPKA